jgi:hypothetical protein
VLVGASFATPRSEKEAIELCAAVLERDRTAASRQLARWHLAPATEQITFRLTRLIVAARGDAVSDRVYTVRFDGTAICLSYDFSRHIGEKDLLGEGRSPLGSGEGRTGLR